MELSDIKLKVEPAALKSVSADVETKVRKVKNAYEELDGIIRSCGSYWEGAGESSMIREYGMRADDYERMFAAIINHVKNLQEIAGVYEQTEGAIVAAESMLPGDVIS